MNHYLIYLSEQFVQDTQATNAALQALNRIGRVALADFNVWVAETEDEGEEVCAAISNAPSSAPFFVARGSQILAYRGDGPFVSALKLLNT